MKTKKCPRCNTLVRFDPPAPSDALRGYYFAVVIPTVRHAVPEWATLSEDDLHEVLKKMFNGFRFFNPITKREELVGRTAMSRESTSERGMRFVEKIRQWLAESYLVELPDPADYKREIDSAPTFNGSL